MQRPDVGACVTGVVGPYRLHDLLGRGAMGEVWSATHRQRGVAAAVKMLLPSKAHHIPMHALQQEVHTIAAIDHPGVVRLFDQGLDAAGQPWLAMEPLRPLIALPSTWDELKRLLCDALSGLAAAHAAHVLHLDIKPSNVLLSPSRGGVLADFGISHHMTHGDSRGVWGSPAYMAPEAFDGDADRLVPQTDLYGIGCLAWTLCTGAPPFDDVDIPALAQAHRSQPLAPLTPRLPVPVGFEAWVQTLLRKRASERFHSAAATLHALQTLPDPPVAQGTMNTVPVGPTLTTWSACPPKPLAQVHPVQPPPTPVTRLPTHWPPAPPLDGWARGCGLADLLSVPWIDRPMEQGVLWQALADLVDGRASRIRVGGGPGSGRTRLVQRFLRTAHRHTGATTLRLDATDAGHIGDVLRTALGERVEVVALRCARRVDEVHEWVALRERDPITALAQLASLTRGPLVIAVDAPQHTALDVHVDGALVVEVIDGLAHTADTILRPFSETVTRRLLAAWAGLDPRAVAEMCEAADGDLAAAVDRVRSAIRQGALHQTEGGWRVVPGRTVQLERAWLTRWQGPVKALTTAVGTEVLRELVVLEAPLTDAWTEHQRALATQLTERGWLHDGAWVSRVGRRALYEHLGDLTDAHRAAAAHSERWARGEHLLAAGDVVEAADLLIHNGWRAAARGEMSRVQRVLTGLDLSALPPSNPLWGERENALARLGPTHVSHAESSERSQRAVTLAQANGLQGDWRDVAKSGLGHQLFLADVQLHPAGTEHILRQFRDVAGDGTYLWGLQAWICIRQHDGWGAMRHTHRILQTGEEGHTQLGALVTYWIGAHLIGHPDARDAYTRASQRFLDAGYLSAEMDVACMRGDMARRQGDLSTARAHFDNALRIAAKGTARADAWPYLGAALTASDEGRLQEAEALFEACRRQILGAGPSWHAVVELHDQHRRHRAGQSVQTHVVNQSIATMQSTGYLDPDLFPAYRALATVPAIQSLVTRALDRATQRVADLREQDTARGPIPHLDP